MFRAAGGSGLANAPALIPDNLAGCCSQLGRLEERKKWLKKAMVIDKHAVKREAIDDADLKPLWDSISGTLWTKEGFRSAVHRLAFVSASTNSVPL
jgi:hypothetical protein